MPPTTTKASVMHPDDISGLLCLPPITDDLQVLWVQAELTEELDDHPQLMNTFSFFPYPSLPEIALLSLRYGLQMEKVKNWFMVQRVRCGISWTPEEIEETRSRLNYTQEQLHFKPLMTLAKKSNLLRTEEFSVRVPKLCTKPGITPTSLADTEPQHKKMRLVSKLTDKDPKRFAEGSAEHHMKRSSRDIAENSKHSSPVLSMHPKKRPIHNPGKPSGAGLILSSNGQEMSPDASYIASEGEHPSSSWNRNNGEAAQLRAFFDQNGNYKREDYVSSGSRRQRKSKEQLSILKSFFLKCQWATREDYMMLEDITGLSRADIIQWFGDTRYALKHGNLRWFREITQDPSNWVDEPQHPDSLNGGYSDSNSPDQELDSSDMPVDNLTASSSHHLVHPVEEEDDLNPEPTSSVRSKHKVSHFKLQVTNCSTPKSSRKSSAPSSLQRKYEILEDFWCSSQDLREGDLQKLVKETGLSRQQIVDWFTYKSKQSDEVEICVVEDEKGDGEEDEEDDIQD